MGKEVVLFFRNPVVDSTNPSFGRLHAGAHVPLGTLAASRGDLAPGVRRSPSVGVRPDRGAIL